MFECRQQSSLQATMVGKDGLRKWIRFLQRLQTARQENRSARLRSHSGCGVQNAGNALLAASRYEQNQIAFRIVGVELGVVNIVTTQFAFDGLDIPLSTHTLGSVVQLNDEVERPSVAENKVKCAVWVHRESTSLQLDAILTSELFDGDAFTVPGVRQLYQRLCQRMLVVMMTMTDFFEVAAIRKSGIRAV